MNTLDNLVDNQDGNIIYLDGIKYDIDTGSNSVTMSDSKTEFELLEDMTGEYVELYVDCEYHSTSEHINNYNSLIDLFGSLIAE